MGPDVAFTKHPNGSVSSLARAEMQAAHQFLPPPVEQVQRYHTKNLPPPPPDRRLSSVSVLSREMNVAFAGTEDMLSLDTDQREVLEKQEQEGNQQEMPAHTHVSISTRASDDVISPQPKSALPKLWKMTGHDGFRTSASREGSIDSTHHMTAYVSCNRSNTQIAPEEVELRRQPHEYEHAGTEGPKNSLTEPWLPSPLSDQSVTSPLQKEVSREPVTAISDTALMDINTALRTLEPEERRLSNASSLNAPGSRLGSTLHASSPTSHIVRRNKPDFHREKKAAPGPSPLKKTPRSAVHDDHAWSRGYRIPDSDEHRSSHDMYHEAAVEMVSKTPPNSPTHISSTASSSKHIPLEQIIKGIQLTEMITADAGNASSEPSSWYSSSHHSTKPLLASPPRPPPSSYHYHQSPREGQQLQNIRRPSGSSAFSALSATSAPQRHLQPGDRSVMASTSTFGGPSHFHIHPPSSSHSRKPSRSSPSPSPSQKPSPPGDNGNRLGDLDGEVHADGDSSMGCRGRRTCSISRTQGTRSIPISRPGSDVVTQTVSIDAKSHDAWSSHFSPSPTSPKRYSSILSKVFRRSTGVYPVTPLRSPSKQKGPYNLMLESAQQRRALHQIQHQFGSDVKPTTPTTPNHLSFSQIVSKAGAAATAPFKTPEERRRSKLKNKIRVYGDEGQLLGQEEGATPFKHKTEAANNETPSARASKHSMLAGYDRTKSAHELMGEGTLIPPNDNPIWMGPGVATYVHGTSVSSTPRLVSTPSGTPGVTSARLSAANTATASGTDSNSVWSRAPTLSATGTPTRTTFGSIASLPPPPPATATRGNTSSPPARYRKTPAGGSDSSQSHSRSPAVGPRLGAAATESRYNPAASLPLPPVHVPPPFVFRSFTAQVSVLDNPLKQTRGTSPRPTPSPKPSNATRSEIEIPGYTTLLADGAAYGGSRTGAVGLGILVPWRTKSVIEREEREKIEGQKKKEEGMEVEGVRNVL
uniref:Uncharacterized protein n=1 Tax=Podospora anserina (strain S / ATCC MYA-4624 / DSM 980 / FGSC 10383) TaxID=515849 RepID=A0A090C8R3_PODAN|nr:Putative protein of unknown function [Podospora anserina S mat+]